MDGKCKSSTKKVKKACYMKSATKKNVVSDKNCILNSFLYLQILEIQVTFVFQLTRRGIQNKQPHIFSNQVGNIKTKLETFHIVHLGFKFLKRI